MRKAAIEAVAAMVQDEEDALALEAFLGHFRGRIVETGSDREAPVCLAALHLLHLLLQHGLVSLQQLLPVMRCAPCQTLLHARASVWCCAVDVALVAGVACLGITHAMDECVPSRVQQSLVPV